MMAKAQRAVMSSMGDAGGIQRPLNSSSDHPRRRESPQPRSTDVVTGGFDGRERGAHLGGHTDDGGDIVLLDSEEALADRSKATVRTKFIADATAMMERLITRAADNLSEDTTCDSMMALFARAATTVDNVIGSRRRVGMPVLPRGELAGGAGGAAGARGVEGTGMGASVVTPTVVNPVVPVDASRRSKTFSDSGAPAKRSRRGSQLHDRSN